MIVLLGDIHGDFRVFERLELPDDAVVIQLGDFGIWPGWEARWQTTPWPVYFMDGNHEYFPIIRSWNATKPVEVAPNLHYLPRGCVLEVDGKRLGCLGGADSVDVAWRQRGLDWFAEEQVTEADVYQLRTNLPIDVLLTHSHPTSMESVFPPLMRDWFELPPQWRSRSAELVERAWQLAGNPPLVCGHMHASRQIGNFRCLDINEVYELR